MRRRILHGTLGETGSIRQLLIAQRYCPAVSAGEYRDEHHEGGGAAVVAHQIAHQRVYYVAVNLNIHCYSSSCLSSRKQNDVISVRRGDT